jgi:hypothetical protein
VDGQGRRQGGKQFRAGLGAKPVEPTIGLCRRGCGCRCGFVAGVLLMGLVPARAHAEGVAIRIGVQESMPLFARSQRAVVASTHGHESLALAITLAPSLAEIGDRPVLWITPVPAPVADVQATILEEIAPLGGEDVRERTITAAGYAFVAMMATQIWPVPEASSAMSVRPMTVPFDVASSSRLPSRGATLTLVDAATLSALRAYARSLGASLPDGAVPALERSTKPGTTFVVYRVDDPIAAWRDGARSGPPHTTEPAIPSQEFPELGIRVTFPATSSYVPLVESSVLGGDPLTVAVTTLGFTTHVGVALPGLRASYFVGAATAPGGASSAPSKASGRITRFEWVRPSSQPMAGLTFRPGSPLVFSIAASLIESSCGGWVTVGLAIALFCALAIAASWVARPIWPRGTRPASSTAAAIGLLHVATVIAPLVFTMRRARRLGAPRRRAAAFVAVSSVVLTIGTAALMFAVRELVR